MTDDLVRHHDRPGLDLTRKHLAKLAGKQLDQLRRDLVTEAMPLVWRIAFEAAFVVENKLGAMRLHALEAAVALEPDQLQPLIDELARCEKRVLPRATAVLEQLVLETTPVLAARAATALRRLGSRADAYVQKAESQQRDPLLRLRSLQIAFALEPDRRAIAQKIGDQYAQLARDHEAVAVYERAAKLDPADPFSRVGLGTSLVTLDRHLDAIAAFSTAIALARAHSSAPHVRYTAICWRARARIKAGQLDRAADDLEAALEFDPDAPEAALVSGELYEAQGLYSQALEAYEDARDRFPFSARAGLVHAIERVRAKAPARDPVATTQPHRDEYQDSFDPMTLVTYPKTPLGDFVGDAVIARVRDEVLLPLQHPTIAADLGLRASTGIGLFGSFGSGKSLLAAAIATETRSPMLVLSPGALASHFIYITEIRLRRLPSWIETNLGGKAVVLIDEAESLAPEYEVGASARNREATGIAVLQLVDTLRSMRSVIVIVASNRMKLVSGALRRSGRIDLTIMMPPPTPAERARLFRRHAQKADPNERLRCDELCASPYSQAEIVSLATSLVRVRLRKSTAAGKLVELAQDDLDRLVEATRPRDLRSYAETEAHFSASDEREPPGFRRRPR